MFLQHFISSWILRSQQMKTTNGCAMKFTDRKELLKESPSAKQNLSAVSAVRTHKHSIIVCCIVWVTLTDSWLLVEAWGWFFVCTICTLLLLVLTSMSEKQTSRYYKRIIPQHWFRASFTFMIPLSGCVIYGYFHLPRQRATDRHPICECRTQIGIQTWHMSIHAPVVPTDVYWSPLCLFTRGYSALTRGQTVLI